MEEKVVVFVSWLYVLRKRRIGELGGLCQVKHGGRGWKTKMTEKTTRRKERNMRKRKKNRRYA